MIRSATRQEIEALLDESYFGGANFTITVGSDEKSILVITFVPNVEFALIVERTGTTGYPFYLDLSPGPNVLKNDRSMKRTMEDCISEIPKWINRIKEEIISGNPLAREVQRFREEVEEQLSALGQAAEGFFSKEEAAALNDKLDRLNQQFVQLSGEHEELKITAAKLAETVRHLQTALSEVNKGTWFRMAAGKLTSFTKSVFTSKEAREFALEAAKKLLLEGPKVSGPGELPPPGSLRTVREPLDSYGSQRSAAENYRRLALVQGSSSDLTSKIVQPAQAVAHVMSY